MVNILKTILVVIFAVDLLLLVWRVSGGSDNLKVLSFVVSVSPTPLPTLTPTPRPEDDQPLAETPTPLPSPTPTPLPTTGPTPTSVSQPKFSQEEIHGFIERFAGQYGVDPNVLRHIAVCESGFRTDAVNGPYTGLYQFGSSSWVNNRQLMGEDGSLDLRFNAEESVQTAAFIVSKGIKNIWPNCFP